MGRAELSSFFHLLNVLLGIQLTSDGDAEGKAGGRDKLSIPGDVLRESR